MKKILVLLCCAAVLPLTACGQAAPEKNKDTGTSVSTNTMNGNENITISEPAVLAPDIDNQLDNRIQEPAQTGTTLEGF
ncbi:hypothetical protein COW46_02095 [Candidatus Gracilibacteria bacterium CG17_big_fil_post_rev_8_21_14_2_50_48_13]|nr:MAG: hypothetical protein COW46_02095 [Candidatus Gracilibacteria bacterium CG17_big_fil_post_rev_8_21_14_2_50_48_13]